MSKYFDGYASFKYEDMSKEKLIAELKEKVRYVGQLKREHSDEIAKTQSSKDKKIFDLEAKLAEKEHTINTLIVDHKASQEWYKKQISALEKQNKRVLEKLGLIVRSNQELEKQHDIDNQVIELIKDNRNRDKISFALEQLEKVKEFCEKELKECDKLLKTEFEDDFYIQSVMARESMCFDFRRTIDNQIKQLKEGK